MIFINDRYPRATEKGQLQTEAEWNLRTTRVKRGASIGSGALIMCDVTIGENALIAAGAVVTHDGPDDSIEVGVLARMMRDLDR